MNSKDLQYVLKIAEIKNFTKAAEQLYISQPALSQSLNRLERNLGVQLFLRSRTQVILTTAGIEFVNEAKKILEKMNSLEYNMHHFGNGQQTSISVGISQFYGKHLLSKIIGALKKIVPSYQIEIIEGESKFLENLISQGKLDFGIFPSPIYSKLVRFAPIYEEEILFSFNKKNVNAVKLLSNMCKGKSIDLSLYKEYPFIMLQEGLKIRVLADKICAAYGFIPKAVFESENLDTVYSLVSDNYGVAFLPSTILQSIDIYKTDVAFYPIKSKFSKRELGIAYKEDTNNDKLLNKILPDLKLYFSKSL